MHIKIELRVLYMLTFGVCMLFKPYQHVEREWAIVNELIYSKISTKARFYHDIFIMKVSGSRLDYITKLNYHSKFEWV